MKAKILLAFVLLAGAGIFLAVKYHPFASGPEISTGRKVLYYTCSMHPWVKEHKPGPCPVCGMNLTPVYETAGGNNINEITEARPDAGAVTLEPENISVIHVKTEMVTNRPITRMLHLAGEIVGNSPTAAWFEFTVYERDLAWLKSGQKLIIFLPSIPGRVYHAQIKPHSTKTFAEPDFDMMSASTTMRAEISDSPVTVGNLGEYKYFNHIHAEAHVTTETERTLAIPRSAVISRGQGPMVYVDGGNGRYAPRAVSLGRTGDKWVEVLAGLQTGETVVTTGNVLIDSEAQLATGQ
jgi:multidrug efflux pump subunit AcrA (membrane-fusion protein)